MAVSAPSAPTSLIQLGDRHTPERIYVGRTEREALGLYQQDELPDRTLLCILGDDGPKSNIALTRIVARHPTAAVHLAIDERQDERAAQAFEARILAALSDMRAPEARVTLRRSVPLEPSSSALPHRTNHSWIRPVVRGDVKSIWSSIIRSRDRSLRRVHSNVDLAGDRSTAPSTFTEGLERRILL